MIAFVSGILSDSTEDAAVVDVSGVGYRVLVSPGTLDKLPAVGTPVKLYTYFCVREDALLLYGFLTKEELGLFKQLITVSGIGPKAGLSLLSVMSVDDLRFAIFSADARAIAKAPGVGKKTAERLVLELKDKIGAPGVLPDAETYAGQEAGWILLLPEADLPEMRQYAHSLHLAILRRMRSEQSEPLRINVRRRQIRSIFCLLH